MTLSANHSDKSDNDMTTNGDITTPGGTANSSAPSENHLPLIIVIAGPTATGKVFSQLKTSSPLSSPEQKKGIGIGIEIEEEEEEEKGGHIIMATL